MLVCLWTISFISALGELSLAGAFATWYWTFDKADVPFYIMVTATIRSIMYHSGTAAFGAVFMSIRRIVSFIASCLGGIVCKNCLKLCVERFIKRFDRNAYVMCAVHGEGLSASGRSAYQLKARNIQGANLVITMIFGLCKVGSSLAAGICGWNYFLNYYQNIPVFPLIVLVLGSYFISGAFFSVYRIAVHTMVLSARKLNFSLAEYFDFTH